MVFTRNLLLLGVGLLITYWIDQKYFGGFYSRPMVKMLREMMTAFK